MTTPIVNTVSYDNSSQRWRDSVTGRYVPESRVRDEMFRHSDATHATLNSLTKQLYAGSINIREWQAGVAIELKDAHLAQAMFGAGGRANMTEVEWGRVGQTLREQYSFLNNFAKEIAAGKISEARALDRISMYGDAATQSYWAEYAERSTGLIYWRVTAAENCKDCPNIAAGSPYTKATLPAYPCDGSTKCLSRCKCYLERE